MPHFPFQRLQADLSALIARLPAGTRLPSEPDLAADLGVSRATLREAMRTFEAQGLIRRRQGAGTYVVGKPPVIESGLEVLESMLTLARRTGLNVGPGPVTIEKMSADLEIARILEVAEGDPLVRVSRTMRAENRPVAYLVDTLPADVLHPEELGNRFSGSVLDYLLSRGDPLTISRTEITAINASAEVAKMLEIQRGDVLLQFIAKLYTASGRVVDYSYSYFVPGYFKFHLIRKVGLNSELTPVSGEQ
ncbi:MAG: GntR family transcriptional regulator [Anaerolineales bacterium]|nr:GntR family transcriptional regulator [Anaerolineales bacterium]MCX7754178.1 GntR family transcriptional regulator [Anaerolineales bacterium]MDW8276972.1 GntR family transcriptional regulator [Anaerolineales bacterium]